MNKSIDKTDENIVLLTKKYLLDMLNATMFSNALMWSGIDQFNELPILTNEEDKGIKMEQRGALLLHRRTPAALRMIVTAHESASQRVCYRIANIKEKVVVDELRRSFLPYEKLHLDFSIADTNLGIAQDSACSFSYNVPVENGAEKSIVFNLLRFLMEAEFVAYDDQAVYADLLDDVLSLPPVPGDPHFKPIFSLNRDN